MYPAFDWSAVLRAMMDISAPAISLADRPQTGQTGHQCSHAPGRPNLHLVSILGLPSAAGRFNYSRTITQQPDASSSRSAPTHGQERSTRCASRFVGKGDRARNVCWCSSASPDHATTSAAARLRHDHRAQRRGTSSYRYQCRLRQSHSVAVAAMACSLSWRPWPGYRWRGRSTAGPPSTYPTFGAHSSRIHFSTIQDCPKHWLPNSGWATSSSPPSRLSPLSGDSGGLDSVSPTFDVAPQQSCQIAWAPVLRRRDAHSKPLQSLAHGWRVECLGRCLIEPVDDRPGRPLREKKSAPDVDSYFRGALLPGG